MVKQHTVALRWRRREGVGVRKLNLYLSQQEIEVKTLVISGICKGMKVII